MVQGYHGGFDFGVSQIEQTTHMKDKFGFYDKYQAIADSELNFADKVYIENEL